MLQDAFLVTKLDHDKVFAVVSDGAGSAKFGRYGARLICRFFAKRLIAWFQSNSEFPSDEELRHWIDDVRDRTAIIAKKRDTTPRNFAATFAAIIAGHGEALTLQIGDSSIVGRVNEEWEVLCWPENGEYASSTFFYTDDPEPRVNMVRHTRNYDAFALFSDGVGDLALSHSMKAAYPRFFGPMISPVDASCGNGCLSYLSDKLSSYLSSSTVCERTDDDKTLILISNR